MSFVAGKIAWILLKPSNLLALVFALGLLLRLLGRRRGGILLMGAVVTALVLVAVLPIGAWLLAPLENRFAPPALPERVDGIIALGGAIDPARSADRGAVSIGGKAERLVAFAAMARRYPNARLVYTGGSGNPQAPDQREADWLAPFLDAVAIPRERVILERDSRNTVENARFTKALVKPQAGETWVLVTSARHMPRSVGIFRKEGWTVIAYPVDYLTPREVRFGIGFHVASGIGALDAAAYEWFGLVYYRLAGRIDSWFPEP